MAQVGKGRYGVTALRRWVISYCDPPITNHESLITASYSVLNASMGLRRAALAAG